MAFTLPSFNLQMSVWRFPHAPAVDPPDDTNIDCQLYVNSKGLLDIEPDEPGLWYPPIWLRVETGGFIPDAGDLYLIVHRGLNLYYLFRWWEYTHAGMPNEYVTILVEQCQSTRICPRHN